VVYFNIAPFAAVLTPLRRRTSHESCGCFLRFGKNCVGDVVDWNIGANRTGGSVLSAAVGRHDVHNADLAWPAATLQASRQAPKRAVIVGNYQGHD
jgi:hypothetical protein